MMIILAGRVLSEDFSLPRSSRGLLLIHKTENIILWGVPFFEEVHTPEDKNLARVLADEDQVLHTHGSFLIRRQRGHPGVVLPLVISNSANR